MSQTVIELVAREFSRLLAEHLRWYEQSAILEVNRECLNDNTCATHNYMDSNMYMSQAIQNILHVTEDEIVGGMPENELTTLVWNPAWDMAKANGFWWDTSKAEHGEK